MIGNKHFAKTLAKQIKHVEKFEYSFFEDEKNKLWMRKQRKEQPRNAVIAAVA